MPVDSPMPEAQQPGTVRWERTYTDPQGRLYRGRVTARRKTPPMTSVEAEVVLGYVALALEPGEYVMSAMLRDPDNVRAFIQEDVRLPQEGSDA